MKEEAARNIRIAALVEDIRQLERLAILMAKGSVSIDESPFGLGVSSLSDCMSEMKTKTDELLYGRSYLITTIERE